MQSGSAKAQRIRAHREISNGTWLPPCNEDALDPSPRARYTRIKRDHYSPRPCVTRMRRLRRPLGVIIPVLPKLVVDFTGGDQARAAKIYGLFGTVWAAMQLVCSPIFGSLSDRFGRRKVILVSNFGLAFDYVVMALAPTWQWLFAGRVVSGITASSIPTA